MTTNLTPDEIKASFRDWSKERHGFEAEPFTAVIEWTQFVLARHGCTALQPQQEGVKPTDADLDALERKHWKLDSVVEYEPGQGCREVLERQETFDHRAFARTVLTRYGRPALQPIAVSERLPGPEDCTPWSDDPDAQPWCWAAKDVYGGWEWTKLSMDHFHSNLGRIISGQGYTHWAPWWALPLPGGHSSGAKEMAEGQPCSP